MITETGTAAAVSAAAGGASGVCLAWSLASQMSLMSLVTVPPRGGCRRPGAVTGSAGLGLAGLGLAGLGLAGLGLAGLGLERGVLQHLGDQRGDRGPLGPGQGDVGEQRVALELLDHGDDTVVAADPQVVP